MLDVRCRRVVLAVQVDSTAKLCFIVQQVEESRSPDPNDFDLVEIFLSACVYNLYFAITV